MKKKQKKKKIKTKILRIKNWRKNSIIKQFLTELMK